MPKTVKFLSLLLVLCLIVGVISGCSSDTEEDSTKTITNLDGSPLEVPKEVDRIAPIFGPSYEKVAAVGAQDRVVMCTDLTGGGGQLQWIEVVFTKYNEVPRFKPNMNLAPIEELLKNDAQLVYFWNTPDQIEKMKEVGIPVIYPDSKVSTLDSFKTDLQVYASPFGKHEQEKVNLYAEYFDKTKKLVSERTANIPESEKPSVYFAIRKPTMTAGMNSHVPEMVTLAGGKCVTSDLQGGFAQEITIEQLLEWNPDVMILDHYSGSSEFGAAPLEVFLGDLLTDNRFKNIKAVQTGRVHVSPCGVMYWDASVQMILQQLWLAKLLHPDKFQDIDMAEELKGFYATVFDCQLSNEQAKKILALEMP